MVKNGDPKNYVTVLGTSKYVTNYDGFSLGVEGNFFPFELGSKYLSKENMTISKNGEYPSYSGKVDRYNVLKIEKGQKWDIKVDNELVVTFDFSETNCGKKPE